MSAYRNVISLIMASSLLQVAGGLLGVIVPVSLGASGISSSTIGIIAAIYSAGFMLAAANAPLAIRQVGNIRCFSAAAASAAAAALIMAMFRDPLIWSVMRFIQGMSFALMFASVESWMTQATPQEKRGSVLGIYNVATKIALVLGPFLAVTTEPTDLEPYLWCGIFFALALLPVCVTKREQPSPPDTAPFPIRRMFEVAPAAVFGVFIAGFSNVGFMSLLPLYAKESVDGSGTAAAAQIMAAAYLGGVLSQWPAGMVSDKIDRRLVIAGMGGISAIPALLLCILNGEANSLLIQLLIVIWGAGSLSFYGLCIAHAADRCEPGKIARMLSGLLFVWAAGSVLGPLVFGVIMNSPLGSRGLFLLEALMGILLAIAMLWRRRKREAAPEHARESFNIVHPTSIAAVEIDPRADSTNESAI